MSNYYANATHPVTGRREVAEWLDNSFGAHAYGVRFDGDDKIYHEDEVRRAREMQLEARIVERGDNPAFAGAQAHAEIEHHKTGWGRLLTKQPRPAGGGEAVWPSLSPRVHGKLRGLLEERHEQGMTKYGQDLKTYDGRDPWADLIQELVDAVFYAERLRMEGGPDYVPMLQRVTEAMLDQQALGTPAPGTETTSDPLPSRRLPSP